MPATPERYMWLFVFFDLPVKTREERGMATRFRNGLLKDGYMMIQFSVYARICNGEDRLQKHLQRLQKSLPSKGNVRALQITDMQYGRIKMLVGTTTKNEHAKAKQLVLF
jgi:CRISPR-associated protein Cas2